MTLIKLNLDESNTVIASGWANPSTRKVGDIDGDFQVYDISDDEIKALVPGHTTLTDGHLIVDPTYTPEPEPEPVAPGASAQDQINASLVKQLADATAAATSAQVAVAALTKTIAGMQGGN